MAEARELLEIKQRLSLIEARLEQLFTHLQVEPLKRPLGDGGESGGEGWWGGSGGEGGESAGPSEKVLELIRKGKKIEAVKAHHEETGLGLAESKKAIDALFEEPE